MKKETFTREEVAKNVEKFAQEVAENLEEALKIEEEVNFEGKIFDKFLRKD